MALSSVPIETVSDTDDESLPTIGTIESIAASKPVWLPGKSDTYCATNLRM